MNNSLPFLSCAGVVSLIVPDGELSTILSISVSKDINTMETRTAAYVRISTHHCDSLSLTSVTGAQWLSGRVLDSRPKGRGFEPHRRHCVVVLEQDTFILA